MLVPSAWVMVGNAPFGPGTRKIAGARRAMLIFTWLDPAWVVTRNVPVPSASKGSWALICVAETYKRGIGEPLKVATTPPSSIGSGRPDALRDSEARFIPKMVINPPGAIAEE